VAGVNIKAQYRIAVFVHHTQTVRELQRPSFGLFGIERQRREQGHECGAAAPVVPDQERTRIVNTVLEGDVAVAKDNLPPATLAGDSAEALIEGAFWRRLVELHNDPAKQPDQRLRQTAAVPSPPLEVLPSPTPHPVDPPQVQRGKLIKAVGTRDLQQTDEQRQAARGATLTQFVHVERTSLVREVGYLAQAEPRDQRLCSWQLLQPPQMDQVGREVLERCAGRPLLDPLKSRESLVRGHVHQPFEYSAISLLEGRDYGGTERSVDTCANAADKSPERAKRRELDSVLAQIFDGGVQEIVRPSSALVEGEEPADEQTSSDRGPALDAQPAPDGRATAVQRCRGHGECSGASISRRRALATTIEGAITRGAGKYPRNWKAFRSTRSSSCRLGERVCLRAHCTSSASGLNVDNCSAEIGSTGRTG